MLNPYYYGSTKKQLKCSTTIVLFNLVPFYNKKNKTLYFFEIFRPLYFNNCCFTNLLGTPRFFLVQKKLLTIL